MPYINEKRREHLREHFLEASDAGELNFVITTLLVHYLHHNGVVYANINDCVGALECAKLELYRRVVSHYEDQKMEANGDVYPLSLGEKK